MISSSVLSLVPKLKCEHIYLTSYSKLWINVSVQVCINVLYCLHGANGDKKS